MLDVLFTRWIIGLTLDERKPRTDPITGLQTPGRTGICVCVGPLCFAVAFPSQYRFGGKKPAPPGSTEIGD